ncbi:neutral/alkaline non-lysosomal ceramidase N-terminal domain-containing protein [Verrucomicrobiota bacterium]
MKPDNNKGAETAASGSALRVGLSSVPITPTEPIWLYGYMTEQRHKPFEGKMHDLYANAIAFEDAGGERSVLITLDLCVLRKRESERLITRLTEQTGLPPERIVVNLSHTHSGPMIGEEDPRRFPVPPEMKKKIADYTDWLIERIADSTTAALTDLRPAKVSWGRGKAGFVRNRRKYDAEGRYSGMGPNPDGFSDPRVTVLRIDEPDGTLRGLVCSLACHAVTLGPTNLMLCGDYPGFAKQFLAERHPNVVSLFVQGCGADANSDPRSTPDQMEWAQRHGRELADEVDRVMTGDMAPIRGPIQRVREWLDLPLRQRSRAELEKEANGPDSTAHNPRRILELLDRGETPVTNHRAPIGMWRLGEDLTLVALPGETVSEYIPRMEKIVDPGRLWIAGYCNEVFGYLPTAKIIREGGYEDRGLAREIGQFDAAVEDVVVEGVRRLAKRVEVAS